LVLTATTCCSSASIGQPLRQQPVARAVRVHHRLERGEGLGGDDHQRAVGFVCRGNAREHIGQMATIDVGDEVEGEVGLGEWRQRQLHHLRTEVGAADAQVDHVPHGAAAMTAPVTGAHALGKRGDAGAHRGSVGGGVLRTDHQMTAGRQSQGGVQHCALLGQVDGITAQQRVASGFDLLLAGEREQGVADPGVDPLLGVVEEDAGGFAAEVREPLGIMFEQRAQRRRLSAERIERPPGGCGGDQWRVHGVGVRAKEVVRLTASDAQATNACAPQ
jgi:hypothetical protein